jgi:hypothetical protein
MGTPMGAKTRRATGTRDKLIARSRHALVDASYTTRQVDMRL